MKNKLLLLFLIVSSTLFCQEAEPKQGGQDTLNILITLYDNYVQNRAADIGVVYFDISVGKQDTVWVKHMCNMQDLVETIPGDPDDTIAIWGTVVRPVDCRCGLKPIEDLIEWYINKLQLRRL